MNLETPHEKAIKTYEILKQRKAAKEKQEYQEQIDRNATGWIGFNKAYLKAQKRYYK